MSTQIPVKTKLLIKAVENKRREGLEVVNKYKAQIETTTHEYTRKQLETAIETVEKDLLRAARSIKLLEDADNHPAFQYIKVDFGDVAELGLLDYDLFD